MSEITEKIGHNIRVYRKKKNLTLVELADAICKSKSTISKYENGEVSVDIETMYDIADALDIHIEQLLYNRPMRIGIEKTENHPSFFNGVKQFYSYLFDGRSNKLLKSVFDIQMQTDTNQFKVMMFMNYSKFSDYQNCETTYYGYIEHYDAITNIQLTNQNSPIEKASAQILASYLSSNMKWGLWNGLSSRPMMPIAAKMLFTKSLLKENDEVIDELRISKNDIRLLRMFNMFPVT